MLEALSPHLETIVAADGVELVTELHEPVGEPRGVCVLSHAMMASRRSLDRPRGRGLCSALVRAGHRVLLCDLRGHGDARPRASEGARWSYDDLVRYDAPALVRRAREIARGGRVVIVGHSLFGHVAIAACGLGLLDHVDAIAAIGANVWERSAEPSRLTFAAKRAGLELFAAIAGRLGHFPARALRIGSDDEPAPYWLQFRRWAREGRYDSLDRRDDYAAAVGRVRAPVLAVCSEGDRVLCPPHLADAYVRRVARHELFVMRGRDAPGHMELACSTRGEPAWSAIVDFFARVAPR